MTEASASLRGLPLLDAQAVNPIEMDVARSQRQAILDGSRRDPEIISGRRIPLDS